MQDVDSRAGPPREADRLGDRRDLRLTRPGRQECAVVAAARIRRPADDVRVLRVNDRQCAQPLQRCQVLLELSVAERREFRYPRGQQKAFEPEYATLVQATEFGAVA